MEQAPEGLIGPEEASEAVDRLGASIPLPPGGSLDALRDSQGYMDEAGFAGMLAYNAACQWFEHWQAAHERGDDATAEAAEATLREIPDWPEIGSPNSWQRFVDAAALGDTEPIVNHLDINCR